VRLITFVLWRRKTGGHGNIFVIVMYSLWTLDWIDLPQDMAREGLL
jgi:hypothetical protein